MVVKKVCLFILYFYLFQIYVCSYYQLDSICVSLWSAITDYNQVFTLPDANNNYMNSNNQLEQIWHKFPPLIERIKETCNNYEGNMKKMMQSRLNIVQELLYHLGPVLRGIRSLARYFHNAAQSTTVDSSKFRKKIDHFATELYFLLIVMFYYYYLSAIRLLQFCHHII